jgi:hypothetical protein
MTIEIIDKETTIMHNNRKASEESSRKPVSEWTLPS